MLAEPKYTASLSDPVKSLTTIIINLFPDPGDLRDRVIAGEYDLLLIEGDAQTIIIPEFLEATIKPGASISMRMWLQSNHRPTLRRPRFLSTPRVGPGPGPKLVRVEPPRRKSYVARDAEVEYRLKAMGFGTDFVAEIQRGEGGFGEVLKAFTNATDGLSELRYEIRDIDTDYDSGSTIEDGED